MRKFHRKHGRLISILLVVGFGLIFGMELGRLVDSIAEGGGLRDPLLDMLLPLAMIIALTPDAMGTEESRDDR